MDDTRVWEFERRLWKGDPNEYRANIDPSCVMAVPAEPFLLRGEQAIEAMTRTPRWTEVTFANQQISRPQEGLIVLGYQVRATRQESMYEAFCTSTYRRLGHEDWRVVQHQQTLKPKVG